MSETAILNLLSSAEQCNERGRHKMAKLALGEIWCLLEDDTEIDDPTFERIRELDEQYADDEEYVAEPSATYTTGTKCDKCRGTGKYTSNGRVCYACKGKGTQDPNDRTRNAAYWAHREKLRELRKGVPAEI